MDWVATVIVVWRFFSGSESDKPEVVEYRELKGNTLFASSRFLTKLLADIGVCLGMLMITISIIFESLYHMITQSRPQDDMMGIPILLITIPIKII